MDYINLLNEIEYINLSIKEIQVDIVAMKQFGAKNVPE